MNEKDENTYEKICKIEEKLKEMTSNSALDSTCDQFSRVTEKNYFDQAKNKKIKAIDEKIAENWKKKVKGYIRIIELLQVKNEEDQEKIEDLVEKRRENEEKLKQLKDKNENLGVKLSQMEKVNKDLEEIKVTQARIINDLYFKLNAKKDLDIVKLDQIGIKNFNIKSIKSLSIDDYESEIYCRENNSFNQDLSLISSIRSGHYINSSSTREIPKLSIKEMLEVTQLHTLPASKLFNVSIFSALDTYNQTAIETLSILESNLNFLCSKFSRFSLKTCEKIKNFTNYDKILPEKRLTEESESKVLELENEIQDLVDREAGYEDIVHDLEEKIGLLLIEKRDLIQIISNEREKNQKLIQQAKSQIDFPSKDPNPEPLPVLTREESVELALKDLEALRSLAETEKNYFLDHIIMIEKENSTTLSSMSEELKDLKTQLRAYEALVSSIEKALGDKLKGDIPRSIKSLVRTNSKTSGWNLFRRSSTIKSPDLEEEPMHIIVSSLHKQLKQEKHFRALEKKQLETLKETLRHLEFERNIGSNESTFKNMRTLILDLFKYLPLQKPEIEKKIQTLSALVWLSKDEKIDIDKYRQKF